MDEWPGFYEIKMLFSNLITVIGVWIKCHDLSAPNWYARPQTASDDVTAQHGSAMGAPVAHRWRLTRLTAHGSV
jgi:hypothetical protein